jgi:hypothetical protein
MRALQCCITTLRETDSVFDDVCREWVTGFRKRKNERKTAGLRCATATQHQQHPAASRPLAATVALPVGSRRRRVLPAHLSACNISPVWTQASSDWRAVQTRSCRFGNHHFRLPQLIICQAVTCRQLEEQAKQERLQSRSEVSTVALHANDNGASELYAT